MQFYPPFLSVIASEVRPTSCVRGTISLVVFSHTHSRIRKLPPLTTSISLSAPRNSRTNFRVCLTAKQGWPAPYCGCDNCIGEFNGIRNRLEEYATRLEVLGRDGNHSLCHIPQGFGSQEYVYCRTICDGIRCRPRHYRTLRHRLVIDTIIHGGVHRRGQRGREGSRHLGRANHPGGHGRLTQVLQRAP